MKFYKAVCAGHFFNLRRKRDARAVNKLEKIGARINMRAARYPKHQQRQWEKTLHAGIFRNAGRMTSIYLHKMAARIFRAC